MLYQNLKFNRIKISQSAFHNIFQITDKVQCH